MNDRFKFNAIVSSYYDVDTPEEYKEVEPQFYLKNVDVFNNGEIGIFYDKLLDEVRKQSPNLTEKEIGQIMKHFEDNSNSPECDFVSITPDKILQCTGLKDKNGKLIYEGDIIYSPSWWWGACFVYLNIGECGACKGDSVMSYILAKNIDNPLNGAIYNIWNGSEVEVIGNIYTDAHLLEETKND